MKMSTYIGLAIIGLFVTIYANADMPGQPLPLPVDQYPPDQSFYCPPGVQMAPPVLPYPGPQLRVVPMPRAFSGFCSIQRVNYNLFVIVLNGGQTLYGPAVLPNVQANLFHYQRIGVCQ